MTKLKYEYKLNQHFSLNLGLYSFNLDGKWIPKPYNPEEDLNQEKKDVHEGYSAILFGIGFDF